MFSERFDDDLVCLDIDSPIETHKGVSLEALTGPSANIPKRVLPFGVVKMIGLNVHPGGSEFHVCSSFGRH